MTKLDALGIRIYEAGAATVKENLGLLSEKGFRNFPCIIPADPIKADADINKNLE